MTIFSDPPKPKLTIASDTIICVYRTTLFHQIDPKDITWSDAIVGIWTNAEATVGVFCACLPTLVPLFNFCIGRETAVSTSDHTPYGTWSSRAEGFKRVVDPHTGEVYRMGNESTVPIKEDAHELNNITVTKNIDQSIKRLGSTENTHTWADDRDTVPFAGTAQ